MVNNQVIIILLYFGKSLCSSGFECLPDETPNQINFKGVVSWNCTNPTPDDLVGPT